MLENVGRKVALIVILLLVSVGLMVVPRFMDPPRKPFQLGLDLQGGTRIVYRVDCGAARANGEIGTNDDTQEILLQAVGVLRGRIDPTGTKEISVRAAGTDEVVIELPGDMGAGSSQAESKLVEGLSETSSSEDALTLADGTGFSQSGVVAIGTEEIRYARRDGNGLHGLSRHNNGKQEAHAVGDAVRLVNSDAIRDAIENLGELAFVLMAEDSDFAGKATDLRAEENKLNTWTTANPGVPVKGFNQVPPDKGGPDPSIRWYATRFDEASGPPRPVLTPKGKADTFRGEALQRIFSTSDDLGYPAVGFEIRPTRIDDFATFTGDNVNRRMAIILNDEIRSAPTLNSKLVGSGIIEGRFKDAEVKNLVTVLRSGSLKLKPILEHDERVGATLGDDYVRRGVYSSVLAMLIVVAFMILYYRRLGVFASLALLTNLLMFLGGLAFMQATLTLPGIAGIVLTVGMAVDANILIFDRLREESEKGRNPKQAAKAGFDNAMSAIIDSNVTTFLSAVVLYYLGTGPVRGFAVTLMIGVLTSVFAALVTTRVFVHWALSRGSQIFKMGRWMADAKFDFLGKTKIAMCGSIVVCVGGLLVFAYLPDEEKLGIDFTGGVEAQLETAKPETIDTMRARVAAIERIGESAEVKPVLNSAKEGGTFTQFRAQFKTTSKESGVGEGTSLRPKIQDALKDILLADAVQVRMSAEGDAARAEVELYFQKAPTEAEVKTTLEGLGLKDVGVALGDRVGAYKVLATTAAGRAVDELKQTIHDAFAQPGSSFLFNSAIPNWTQVGPQVVGELRDNALLALFASLFITVIYLRVRFAEYSYGVAAMVALVHDVLVTLAALAIGNYLGIVNGEINLATIAVFLTIIGYSVNDTIVIFDRVRENLPKTNAPLKEVLNTSINETLSRTIMTSLTVFLTIVVQYLFNYGTGNVLETISYAMIFGTLSGVYSTVYIANPIFLWMEERGQKNKGSGASSAQVRARRDAERKRLEAERKQLGEGEDGEEGLAAGKV